MKIYKRGLVFIFATLLAITSMMTNILFLPRVSAEEVVSASFSEADVEGGKEIFIQAIAAEGYQVDGIKLPDETEVMDDKATYHVTQNGEYSFVVHVLNINDSSTQDTTFSYEVTSFEEINAVNAIVDKINALPSIETLEAMSEQDQQIVQTSLSNIMNEMDALSDDDYQTLMDTISNEKLVLIQDISDFFVGQVNPLINGSGYGVDNATSQIGGVNFVNSGTSGTLSLNAAAGTSGTINVKFPAGVTDGIVKISVPLGIKWESEGDMNGKGTASGVANSQTMIVPAFGTPINMEDYTWQYTVNPNMTEVAITNFVLKQNTMYAGRTLAASDQIKVEVSYNGSVQDTVYINAIDLTTLGTAGSSITPTQYLFTGTGDSIIIGGDNAPGANTMYFTTGNVKDIAIAESIVTKVTPTSITSSAGNDMNDAVFVNLDPARWTMTGPDGSGAYTFTANLGTGSIWAGNGSPTGSPAFKITYPNADFDDGDKINYKISTTATYLGGVAAPAVNDQLFTVELLPQQVSLTTNIWDLNSAISNNLSTQDITYPAPFGDGIGATGFLGGYYIGNKGGLDSGPTMVSLDFDSTVIGVRGLRVIWPFFDGDNDGNNDITLTDVTYTTTVNSTPQAFTGTITDYEDNTGSISPAMLGLADGEYLTNITYKLSSIPSASAYRNASHDVNYKCYWEAAYFGDILQVGQQASTTLSLIDAGTSTLIQSGKIFTDTSDTNGSIYPWMQQNVAMSSGDSRNVTVGFRSDPISYGSTSNPIFYIRNPSDAVIDINSITITDRWGNTINASDLIVTKYTNPADPDAKEIVKIDTSNITNGDMGNNSQDCEAGIIAYENAFDGTNGKLTFDIYAPVTAQSGDFLWRDMLFIEDPNHTVLTRNDGTSDANFTVADPYGLNPSTGGYIAGLPSLVPATANNTFLHIDGRSDMAVTNAIKYSTDPESSYTTYSQGNEFLIMDPPTTTDIKVSLTNATGVNGTIKTGTTLYLPIPKLGEDWGTLMNPSSQQFQFSTELTAPMTNPNNAIYDIFYGAVTPTDSNITLDSYIFESYNAANAANYNCIKLVQKQDTNYKTTADPGKTLVETNTTNFVVTLKLTANDSLADDQFDIWSPYYHELYTANGGTYGTWAEGEEVALSTALGQIEGTIWLDDNADGIQQAAETGLPNADKDGWTIKIYEKTDFDTNGVAGATELGKVVTGDTTVMDPFSPANPLSPTGTGYYRFDKLDRTKTYVLTAENTSLAGQYYFTVLGTSADAYMNNTYVNKGTYAASNADAGDPGVSATRQVQKQAAGEVNAAKNGIYPLGLTPPIFKTAQTPQDTTGAVGQVNGTVTYTINYTNNTSSTANIEISDKIPTNTVLTNIPTGAIGYSDAAMTTTTTNANEVKALKWTITGVLADQTGSVSFIVSIKDTAINTDITNKATVKVGATSVDTNEVKTYVPGKTVTSESDSTNGSYETLGKNLTYTIAYKNTASTTETIVIIDKVPTNTVLTAIPTGAVGYSDIAMTTTTTNANEVKALKWTLANITAGTDGTVSFVTKVSEAALNTDVKNTASIQVGTNTPSTTNETSTFIEGKKVTSGVDGTTGALSMAVKDTITYSISYKNTKDTAQTIVITDIIPTNTVLVAIPTGAVGYSDIAMTTVTANPSEVKALKWTLSNVTAGTSSNVSFNVKPTKDAIQTEVKNSASIKLGNDAAVTTNEVKTYVQGKKVVTDSDTTNGLWEIIGGNIHYTIAYKNTYSTAQDVTVTDVLPANTVLTAIPTGAVGYSDAAMTTTTTNADEVKALKWTVTGVPANTAGTVTFTLKATSDASGSWINNVGNVQVGTGNPTQETNAVSTFITGKQVESDVDTTGQTVVIGGNLVYYISYINTESTTKDVVITDEIPANTELVVIPGGAIGYSDTAMTTTTMVASEVKVLKWTMTSIAPAGVGSLSFAVKVLDTALDSHITNEAVITVGPNTFTTNTTDTYAAGKSVDKDQANVSDTLTYTIYYQNNAADSVTVTVTDEIPANTQLVTIPTGAVGYSDTAMITVTTNPSDVKALKWEILSVAAGATGNVTFDVTVLDAAKGTVVPNTGEFIVDNNPAIQTNTVNTAIAMPPVVPTPNPTVGPWLVTYVDCQGNTVKVEWVGDGHNSTKPNGSYSDVNNVHFHYTAYPNNCSVKYKSPNTGVNTNSWIYYVLGGITLLGAVILINKAKKKV